MYFKIIFRVIIILFCLNYISVKAQEKIVYIDMNKIMSNSLVGKSLNDQLKSFNQKNSNKFQKLLDELKSTEAKLISQKNVIEKKEFEKKYRKIQLDFSEYQKTIDVYNNDFNKKTIRSKSLILENLTPILSEYAKNNSTSLILNKKNVIIGKTDLDITDQIIKKLDEKIKKINLEN